MFYLTVLVKGLSSEPSQYGWVWACWDLNLVVGLEAKRGGRNGSEDTHHCLSCKLPYGKPLYFPQAIQFSPSDGEVTNSTEGGSILQLAKKIHQNLKAQRPQLHEGLPIYSIPLYKIPLLPNQCPTLTGNSLALQLGLQLRQSQYEIFVKLIIS